MIQVQTKRLIIIASSLIVIFVLIWLGIILGPNLERYLRGYLREYPETITAYEVFIEPTTNFYMNWPVDTQFQNQAQFQDYKITFLLPKGASIRAVLGGQISEISSGHDILQGLPENIEPFWVVTIKADEGYELDYIFTGEILTEENKLVEAGEVIAKSDGSIIRYLYPTDTNLSVMVIKDGKTILLSQDMVK